MKVTPGPEVVLTLSVNGQKSVCSLCDLKLGPTLWIFLFIPQITVIHSVFSGVLHHTVCSQPQNKAQKNCHHLQGAHNQRMNWSSFLSALLQLTSTLHCPSVIDPGHTQGSIRMTMAVVCLFWKTKFGFPMSESCLNWPHRSLNLTQLFWSCTYFNSFHH